MQANLFSNFQIWSQKYLFMYRMAYDQGVLLTKSIGHKYILSPQGNDHYLTLYDNLHRKVCY